LLELRLCTRFSLGTLLTWETSTHSYYNLQPYWQATKDVAERDPATRPLEH
jgi:hypothetical protein